MCPHLDNNICSLASWIANNIRTTTPENCEACNRTEHPQDINPVVISLAGIEEKTEGPGTDLQKVISWFIRQPKNCSCPDRVKVMNAWGYERCRQEKKTILGWLRESALDNNYPYSEYVINIVLSNILNK